MTDRLERLVHLRDQLTTRLGGDITDRDFATLAARLTDVLAQIEVIEKAAPAKEGTALDEVTARREAKASPSSGRTSRGRL